MQVETEKAPGDGVPLEQLYKTECLRVGVLPNSAILRELTTERAALILSGTSPLAQPDLVMSLKDNIIGSAGLRALFPVLRFSHRTLHTLNLSGNHLGNSAIVQLAQLLASGFPALRRVELGDNPFTYQAAKQLIHMCEGDARLRRLPASLLPDDPTIAFDFVDSTEVESTALSKRAGRRAAQARRMNRLASSPLQPNSASILNSTNNTAANTAEAATAQGANPAEEVAAVSIVEDPKGSAMDRMGADNGIEYVGIEGSLMSQPLIESLQTRFHEAIQRRERRKQLLFHGYVGCPVLSHVGEGATPSRPSLPSSSLHGHSTATFNSDLAVTPTTVPGTMERPMREDQPMPDTSINYMGQESSVLDMQSAGSPLCLELGSRSMGSNAQGTPTTTSTSLLAALPIPAAPSTSFLPTVAVVTPPAEEPPQQQQQQQQPSTDIAADATEESSDPPKWLRETAPVEDVMSAVHHPDNVAPQPGEEDEVVAPQPEDDVPPSPVAAAAADETPAEAVGGDEEKEEVVAVHETTNEEEADGVSPIVIHTEHSSEDRLRSDAQHVAEEAQSSTSTRKSGRATANGDGPMPPSWLDETEEPPAVEVAPTKSEEEEEHTPDVAHVCAITPDQASYTQPPSRMEIEQPQVVERKTLATPKDTAVESTAPEWLDDGMEEPEEASPLAPAAPTEVMVEEAEPTQGEDVEEVPATMEDEDDVVEALQAPPPLDDVHEVAIDDAPAPAVEDDVVSTAHNDEVGVEVPSAALAPSEHEEVEAHPTHDEEDAEEAVPLTAAVEDEVQAAPSHEDDAEEDLELPGMDDDDVELMPASAHELGNEVADANASPLGGVAPPESGTPNWLDEDNTAAPSDEAGRLAPELTENIDHSAHEEVPLHSQANTTVVEQGRNDLEETSASAMVDGVLVEAADGPATTATEDAETVPVPVDERSDEVEAPPAMVVEDALTAEPPQAMEDDVPAETAPQEEQEEEVRDEEVAMDDDAASPVEEESIPIEDDAPIAAPEEVEDAAPEDVAPVAEEASPVHVPEPAPPVVENDVPYTGDPLDAIDFSNLGANNNNNGGDGDGAPSWLDDMW